MDLDGLFQLPLDQFTAARNALSGRLKKAGRTEEAANVRMLNKPPLSAWAVNQLHWRHRPELDQLVKAGQQFVKAQAAQLSGKRADLQAALDARREALAQLATRAADILRAAGHQPSPDIMRRVTTTLEALATYGNHQQAPRAGHLTDDVDPPGFEALAALVPLPTSSGKAPNEPTRVLPFTSKPRKTRKKLPEPDEAKRRAAKQAEAKKRLAAAQQALHAAVKEAARAEAALKRAAAAAKAAEAKKQTAEAAAEKASAAAEAARHEARRVAAQAEEAAQVVADAERTLEETRRTLSSS